MEARKSFEVRVVEHSRNYIVFDVKNMPPKWAVTLTSTMEFDVPTMKGHIVTMNPKTNTVMDYQQWANRLGQLVLDSTHIDEIKYVDDCDCEDGGSCCQASITMNIINKKLLFGGEVPEDGEDGRPNLGEKEIPVYTDDIVPGDPRFKLIHRSFSVRAIYNVADGVELLTDEPHTFSNGDLGKFPSHCSFTLTLFFYPHTVLFPSHCSFSLTLFQ